MAGRANSGRRIGLRTVPLIKEPVPVVLAPKTDLVELPRADGGLAVPDDATDTLDATLEPRFFDDCDFGGE